MRKIRLKLGVLLALCVPMSAAALDTAKLMALKRQIDENEPKQLWKKINWAADMDRALKQAQEKNKPVLVFLLVNEKGKKDAEHC